MSDKYTLTGKIRFRVQQRYILSPLIVMETEYQDNSYYGNKPKDWRDARLEDLTELSSKDSIIQGSGNQGVVRYRAHSAWYSSKIFLVAQVIDDQSYDGWRDAEAQDLLSLQTLGYSTKSGKA